MRKVLAEAAHTTPLEQLRGIIVNAVIVLGRHRLHVAVFYQEFRFLSGDSYSGDQDASRRAGNSAVGHHRSREGVR